MISIDVRTGGDAMKPQLVTINLPWGGRVLAWSALVAVTFLFAALVQALAASAGVVPGPDAPTDRYRAALAAGDHVRESFLAHSCG